MKQLKTGIMSKLVDYPTLAKPIYPNCKKEPLDKLKVEIDHAHGGCSFLTGENYESGVYVFLTPCTHKNGVTRTYWDGNTHTMGYKILLKEMSRKSQKQINLAADLIIPYAQQIANYYSDGNHPAVYKFIMKLYKSEK